MTDLFIGVVSHERSRFTDAQGSEGVAARLAHAWTGLGLSSRVQINTRDLVSESGIDITPEVIGDSPAEELRIERQWAQFLERPMGPGWWGAHALRWSKYWASHRGTPDPASVTRLLNIELSHVDLMQSALDSDSSWLLLLEDDAGCSDIADLAKGLRGLVSGETIPRFANLSQSFDLDRLGVSHLLQPAAGAPWQGSASRSVLTFRRPVTNTVCAIMYRRDFLADLMAEWRSLPMTPVAPIDWKLNRALMGLWASGDIRPGDCWWVEPGPIVQRSMHA